MAPPPAKKKNNLDFAPPPEKKPLVFAPQTTKKDTNLNVTPANRQHDYNIVFRLVGQQVVIPIL